jgi:glucuronoarabinoxylan endo-1,4-beta-xylanase
MYFYQPTKVIIKTSFSVLVFFVLMAASCKKDNSGGGTTNPEITMEGQVVINTVQTFQTIKGFGCATVFNPPNTTALTAEEFDRLFGSNAGQVGLNILRIRVATDAAWRNTELNHAKWAIQRGAIVMASPWSPPAAFKTNNSLIGGTLKPDSAAAYAKYLNDFADYMSANGAPLYAVSVQNEPDITVNYESCDWTASAMTDFLKNHGSLITSTRVIAPESFNNNQTFTNTILNDNLAAAYVDIVGGHIYGSGIVENTVAKTLNKEIWMTEHLDTNVTYTGNLNTAIEVHNCLTKANFNAYIWWYGKRFYGPIGQDGLVTKRGFILSQFARFVKPGSVRIGSGIPTRPEVLVSAYRNGSKHIIVAINTAAFNVNQQVEFSGAAITGSFVPYTTSLTVDAQAAPAVSATNNKFTFKLPPTSVVTFVEQ